jgi:hypothetical protein
MQQGFKVFSNPSPVIIIHQIKKCEYSDGTYHCLRSFLLPEKTGNSSNDADHIPDIEKIA